MIELRKLHHIENISHAGYPFSGFHVLGELYGISRNLINNVTLLETIFLEGIAKSGATLCSVQAKEFEPFGCTMLALLSESHASLHVYPEYGALFLDVFTCGTRCSPELFLDHLVAVLKPRYIQTSTISRGDRNIIISLGDIPAA